jgi:hypothetical protein
MIKTELIDLKVRVTALEEHLTALSHGAGEPTPSGVTGETPIGEGPSPSETISMAEQLKEATYTIRQATTSARGYLMLLDQMGLSKDQKKMIKELESAMMMIMKLITTIRLLALAYKELTVAEAGPIGIVYGVFAAGTFAASMAYGSKLTGGSV